jgi:signal transduction histidine kinase
MRPIDVIPRGEAVWVSYDSALVHLLPGRAPEILGADQGIPAGGAFLEDREGSLWVGTFRGLLQFPAPETVAWGGDEGLNTGPRRLAQSPEGIWVGTWQGLYLMRRTGGTWRPEHIPGTTTNAICTASDGTLWTGSEGRFLVRRAGRFLERRMPGLSQIFSCAPAPDGRVWLGTNLGLFLGAHDSGSGVAISPRAGPPLAIASSARTHVMEDAAGGLWVSAGEEICRTDARSLSAGRSVAWSCERAAGAGEITFVVQAPSGDVWAATVRQGVIRLRPGKGWEPVPGASLLPGQMVRALRRSPSEGIWIVSFGTVLRVVERPDVPEGWEIVERPSPWHGLMISDAEDILEEPRGDLWITTLAELVHVPADVRRSVPPVPPVELVDVLSDGEGLPADAPIRLPYRRNRIDLRFAALVLAAVAAAVVAVFRYRLAQSLRIERTRTRIAADLHDDIGASLSRIALQSELVRRRQAPRPAEADRLLVDIGESARALVDSMSDIVWSIDPRRDDLASVIARVRQLALDLLEPRGIALEFRTPEGAEQVRLGPEHRRHLYLILKEAVNNIVKHSGCGRVWITLRAEGDRLHVEVRDDGRGFAGAVAAEGAPPSGAGGAGTPGAGIPGAETLGAGTPGAETPGAGPAGAAGRGGHGLANMAYRAGQMRGRFEVRSAPGEGTVLTLSLPMRGVDA